MKVTVSELTSIVTNHQDSERNHLVLNWKEPIKVAGLRIGIKRLDASDWGSTLRVLSINCSSFDGFYFNTNEGDNSLIRLLEIGAQSIGFTSQRLSNTLVVTIGGDSISLCRNEDGFGSKMFKCIDENHIELYVLNEANDCHTPDSPFNANPVTKRLSNTNDLQANFTCKEGFRPKANIHVDQLPVCGKNGDWSSSDYMPCEPETCYTHKIGHSVKLFEPKLVLTGQRTMAEIGTKAYLQCTKPRNDSYVTCQGNGEWTNVPKDCFLEEECQPQSDRKYYTMLSSSVGSICLVVLAIVMISWRLASVRSKVRGQKLSEEKKLSRARYSRRKSIVELEAYDEVNENIYEYVDPRMAMGRNTAMEEDIYMEPNSNELYADVTTFDEARNRASRFYRDNKRQSNLIKF